MPDSFSIDDVMSVCIAHQMVDGELVAQGLATPLVMAGVLLAKLTHAPNLRFASAIGQSLCEDWAPLGLARIEDLWLGKALIGDGFIQAATEVLPYYAPKEFFRPAQVNPYGSFNNIAIKKPFMRLPGVGGIPDVTSFSPRVYLYVPRHSKATFVETLDHVSGLGHDRPHQAGGAGPVYLVSDLGQFDWAEGRMRITSLHPGVTLEQVQRKTGFELSVAPTLAESPTPNTETLRLLREEIDPLNIRKLETLGGQARKDLLREILAKEGAL